MAVWELALIIFAFTYLMVNTVYLVIQIKMMTKMSGVVDKSVKITEKMLNRGEGLVDKMFDELEEEI